MLRSILGAGAALILAGTPVAAHEYAGGSTADGAAHAQLPLAFEPNQGQTEDQVDFLARGRGYTLFLTPAEAVLSVRGKDTNHVLRMLVVDGQSQASATGLEQLPGRVNYLIGGDAADWRTDLPTFGRVQYTGVYPGVDLAYYGRAGQLEYDFIVEPGADPATIALAFDGAQTVELDGAGDLLLRVPGGEVRQARPVAYQDIAGQRLPVEASFSIQGDRIGFEVGPYAQEAPLVIDPVLEYATFLGGSGDENYWGGVSGAGIAVDAHGAAYVVGSTTSSEFPGLRRGVLDPKFDDGGMDAFVAKINPAGTALEYATYLGGVGFDMGLGIALDAAGNAYVTGLTTSANDFPLVNAYQGMFGGGAEDAFVAKLNPSGSSLVFSTFLGGNGPGWGEAAYGIAVYNNTAHVVGVTNSTDFPLANAAQPAVGGMTDIFVTRFNVAGTGLMYSTFLGGADEDIGYGIAVDRFGAAYVTGIVRSDGLATPGVLQPTRSGPSDAIVAKYRETGTRQYATYLGGGGDEIGYGLAADTGGNAYVAGRTGGTFHTTPGWFDPTCLDPAAFVAKLNPTATGLVYAGCLDAPGKDGGLDLAIDRAGNAYVTGFTLASAFPVVDAFQTALKGTQDAFVAKVNAAGTELVYSSFLGGTGSDAGLAIAVDYSGHAYVTGIVGSPVDFPTHNPLQPGFGGGSYDAFVVKIDCGP